MRSNWVNGSGAYDPTAGAVLMEERAVAEARVHEISEERLSKMTLEEIKPRVCGKYGGDVYKCVDCPIMCRYGRRIVEIIDNETKPIEVYPEDKVVGMRVHSLPSAERKKLVQKRYEHAIDSGDPVEYLKKCGMTEESAKAFIRTRKALSKAEEQKAMKVDVSGLAGLIDEMRRKSQALTNEAIELDDEIKKLAGRKKEISDQVNALNEAIKTLRKAGEIL